MGLQHSQILYSWTKSVDHYYLCHYRPFRTGSDKISKSLLRFKNALAHDLQAWTDCTVQELSQLIIQNDTIIIRALHSDETMVDISANTSLDNLGKMIAAACRLNWMPHLIQKPRPIRKVKLLSKKERRKELKNAYYLSPQYFDFNGQPILLIDDIVTTGATVISIIRLIKEYFPRSTFTVFSLAKAAGDPLLNKSLHLKGKDYAWEEDTGWLLAESDPVYNNYEQLKNCILNDDFS